jgi:hypothetical protein
MVWINGLWITTQSKIIISPPNRDKLLIIIMQIALKQYIRLNQSQIMRGSRWIFEMEMLGMMLMLIESSPDAKEEW